MAKDSTETWQAAGKQDGRPHPALLHILHSWGGGTARWTEDFIRYFPERRHLILYSVSDRNVFGRALELVDPAHPETPLAIWELTPAIPTTAITHPQYGAILSDLIAGLAVEAIAVSSLIGHSLETLTTGLPTLRVLHDLYPYCPAMFGYFVAPCERCDQERLAACLRSNPQNECWHNSTAADWLAIRRAYAAAILKPEIRLTAPTRTVRDRLYQLYPEIAGKTCHLIAHGIDTERMGCSPAETSPHLPEPASPPPAPAGTPTEAGVGKTRKLRVVVPGRLEPHKGLELLQKALPQLTHQAEFLLLGCGMFGQAFTDIKGITTVTDYNFADLGPLVRDFAPDCALLLSTLPETFSYTLSEMSALGIPTLATNLGAFAERIQHGINGFLYQPDAQSLTKLVASLAQDRASLLEVARHLGAGPRRHARDMVQEYQALLLAPNRPANHGGWLALGIESAQSRQCLKYRALEQETRCQIVELEKTHRQLEKARHTLTHCQTRASALEHELTALRRSNSWRMTAPLRTLSTALRTLRTRLTPKPAGQDFASVSGGDQKTPSPCRKQAASTRPADPEQFAGEELGALPPSGKQASEDLVQPLKLRARLRAHLGIPDAARIVLGIAQQNRPEAGEAFIRAAARQAATQRNLYFLWLEGENMRSLPARSKAMGQALAPRRLLFVQAAAFSLTEYLAASDLIYLPEAGAATGPTQAEIALLGVPIINVPPGHDLTTALTLALSHSAPSL